MNVGRDLCRSVGGCALALTGELRMKVGSFEATRFRDWGIGFVYAWR